MPTIDMQDTNRRAIVALNYASFLDDRHYLSHQGITAELVQRQRLTKSRKLLDELGEMLELTDDFLGAFARLEDFSPLVVSPRRNPNGIDCKWHRKQNKRGVPTTMYEELQQWIDESRRIVFFGGAGVSTESGIPDFRSQDGLYHQQFAYPPEEILSHTFFARHPEEFFRFYRAKMLPLDAQPNDAHRFLAQLEAGGRLTAVITQNIDGLHQKAGSKTVLELHGSIHRNYCLKCARFFPPEYIRDSEGVPKCPCGGIIKPDVVLYEEGLDDATVRAAVRQLQQAELLIVAGTSLTVYPAASLLRFFRGRHIVLINRDATPLDNQADLVLHERVGAVCRHLRPTPLEVGE